MEEPVKTRLGPPAIALFIAAWGFVLWANALTGPFVFDDWVYVASNPYVKDLSSLLDLRSPRYVAYLSFALNYLVSGEDPFGYHLFNVTVHIINSLLVFYAVLGLLETPAFKKNTGTGLTREAGLSIAALSSLIFLTHPLQTQAVTYITQRFTSLAAMFYLSSVLFYLKSRGASSADGLKRKGVYYGVSLLFAVLAMKTKEIAFTLPFALFIIEVRLLAGPGAKVESGGKHVRGAVKRLLPFLLTLVISPLSLYLQNISGGPTLNEIEAVMASRKLEEAMALSRWDYLITQSTVIMKYLRLLIWPAGQQFDYYYPLKTSLLDPSVLLSSVFLLTILAVSVYLFFRTLKTGDALLNAASFGVIWFFLTISVESSIIPIHDAINEHRMYLPSFGIILFFSASGFRAYEWIRERWGRAERVGGEGGVRVERAGGVMASKVWTLLAVMAFLTAVPFSAATFLRNEIWRDEVRLYGDEVMKNPYEASPHNYLGIAYSSGGRLEDAASEFREALQIKPGHIPARTNLAHAYLKLGRLNEATAEFKTLTTLNPGNIYHRINLSVLYLNKGLKKEAGEEIKKALEINPENKDAQKVLAYMKSNKKGRIMFR